MIDSNASQFCGSSAPRARVHADSHLSQSTPTVDHQMQKALYVVVELLGMLRRLDCDPRYSHQVEKAIDELSLGMDFLIKQCEHKDRGTLKQQPKSIKLGAQVVCEECKTSAMATGVLSASTAVLPSLPSTWGSQLEFLLTATQRVGFELFEQRCASSTPGRFPNCLVRLRNNLLRQQQYITPKEGREGETAVEYPTDSCAICGRPIAVAQEAEER